MSGKFDHARIIRLLNAAPHDPIARSEIYNGLRELDQLRSLASPIQITEDEMSNAWLETHDREHMAGTRDALNAIILNRGTQR